MIINAGNIVPIYDKITDQWRYKADPTFYIPADRTNLIPMQFRVAGTVTDITWQIVKHDGTYSIDLDPVLLDKRCLNSDYTWFTWDASTTIGKTIGCDRYFVVFTVDGTPYYSEMLYLQELGGPEYADMTFTCSTGPDQIDIVENDTLSSTIISEQIDVSNDGGLTWTNLGADAGVIGNAGSGVEHKQVRRIVKTAAGNILRVYYVLTIDFAQPWCDDWVASKMNENNFYAQKDRYEIRFSHTKDIDPVLYPGPGYVQKMYMDACFDYPGIQRSQQVIINGEGTEVVTSAITKELRRFEVPQLIDPWLYAFSIIGDHDTVILKAITTGEEMTVNEYKFSPRDGSDGYHSVGQIEFLGDKFVNQCPENVGAINCP